MALWHLHTFNWPKQCFVRWHWCWLPNRPWPVRVQTFLLKLVLQLSRSLLYKLAKELIFAIIIFPNYICKAFTLQCLPVWLQWLKSKRLGWKWAERRSSAGGVPWCDTARGNRIKIRQPQDCAVFKATDHSTPGNTAGCCHSSHAHTHAADGPLGLANTACQIPASSNCDISSKCPSSSTVVAPQSTDGRASSPEAERGIKASTLSM